MKQKGVVFAFLLMLTACGGGGSDTANPNPARPAPPPNEVPPSTGDSRPIVEGSFSVVYGQSTAVTGESVGLAVVGNDDDLAVSWRQTAGPAVTILATQSQVIGFDVRAAGEYTFIANVSQSNGQSESLTVDLSVSSGVDIDVNIRVDHAVTELGSASLHAQVSPNKSISSITWQQVSGPEIQDVQYQDQFVFFNAPAVEQDEIVVMRAEVAFSDGTSAIDDAILTVNNVAFDTDGLFYSNNFIIPEDMRAYIPESPWKDALESCVYNNKIPERPTCDFNTLPLIGSVTERPTIEDVLERTLVSHPWMGDRFRAFLQNSITGPDMLMLLRGVTAIVISYEVKPSFYWVATGAIYLDATNFWESAQERDTLNDQPDFRSDFGSDLNFSMFWRYTKDDQYYYPALGRYEKSARENRSFEDIEASISWLMYHELSHANDFFPSTTWQNIDRNLTPLQYFQRNGANSDILDTRYPLRSDEMHALAQVRFGGETPTVAQSRIGSEDVELFFTPDIAPSFYAYYTTREDYATLAERFFMLHRLNAQADVAIIDRQEGDDFVIAWGQRNRISEPSLQERTAFAVSNVYPEIGNVAAIQSQLPPPVLMNPAIGWIGNLNLSGSPEVATPYSLDVTLKERALLDQQQPHAGRPVINR
ncbi:hypothetical protein KJ365_01710 [Glaciecola sp. XM2]|uniref:hypothetical protein n=1 Tax=Glaciecola sp. XM2 TaxID=1914931 RepID=UPI001BDDF627|nr:hypothetical protein [Glaciecola sp. XM2]MBT1449584.1 hypothetical protein [Glaciecola sp. XM2]